MRLRNPKAKGSRLERRARDEMIASGRIVIKAGGSLGPVDLIGINPTTGDVLMVQVKSNRWPGVEEMKGLHGLRATCLSPNIDIAIWRYRDRKPKEVREIPSAQKARLTEVNRA